MTAIKTILEFLPLLLTAASEKAARDTERRLWQRQEEIRRERRQTPVRPGQYLFGA